VPIYFWSRRHPSTPISLFGLLTITAPYLPFALVAFSWVLSGTWRAAASDLVGCAVGHVGWFIRDVWIREMVGGPTIFSEAPRPLSVYFFSSTPHCITIVLTLISQETSIRRSLSALPAQL
jgi:Derlin-2/3